jgi:hypothetical protein
MIFNEFRTESGRQGGDEPGVNISNNGHGSVENVDENSRPMAFGAVERLSLGEPPRKWMFYA